MAKGSFSPVSGDKLFQDKHAFPHNRAPVKFLRPNMALWSRGPPRTLALDSASENSALFPQEKKGWSLAQKRPKTCIGGLFLEVTGKRFLVPVRLSAPTFKPSCKRILCVDALADGDRSSTAVAADHRTTSSAEITALMSTSRPLVQTPQMFTLSVMSSAGLKSGRGSAMTSAAVFIKLQQPLCQHPPLSASTPI
ncbi:hypothetical protein SKAU_G00358210 [Synaphobranchus kaupii]|uniref:Uncharacterized protein n=1 Tax=Synaphobranchus kaupii TaxID=118154 RepID=A0A9Q1EHR7_SYNKA|nr:hypothetical protein SKAU_G00358210 [Synaphobranchus kaupii]